MAVAEKAKKLNKESVRGWLENRKGWKRRANKLTKESVSYTHLTLPTILRV